MFIILERDTNHKNIKQYVLLYNKKVLAVLRSNKKPSLYEMLNYTISFNQNVINSLTLKLQDIVETLSNFTIGKIQIDFYQKRIENCSDSIEFVENYLKSNSLKTVLMDS